MSYTSIAVLVCALCAPRRPGTVLRSLLPLTDKEDDMISAVTILRVSVVIFLLFALTVVITHAAPI
jgi:hypothetical protein